MTQPIPDAALDDRLGFVGTAGSGKSYNAMGRVERLLTKRARVCCVDPLGVFWGLRSMPDGKNPSGFDIPIFGGPHGDLPLTEHSGALIGETVAGMAESCIIDLSEIEFNFPESGSPTVRPADTAPTKRPAVPRAPSPAASGDGTISKSEQKIIDSVRWWNVMGIEAPSHAQVAFIAGYSHKSGTWSTYLSRLRSAGMIEGRGDLVLTGAGLDRSNGPDVAPSREGLWTAVLGKIDAPLQRILKPLIAAYPDGMSHEDAAAEANYSPTSGTWSTYLSRLRSLDLIDGRGELKAQGWLFP